MHWKRRKSGHCKEERDWQIACARDLKVIAVFVERQKAAGWWWMLERHLWQRRRTSSYRSSYVQKQWMHGSILRALRTIYGYLCVCMGWEKTLSQNEEKVLRRKKLVFPSHFNDLKVYVSAKLISCIIDQDEVWILHMALVVQHVISARNECRTCIWRQPGKREKILWIVQYAFLGTKTEEEIPF